MAVMVNGQELTLSGAVGLDWFEDGFTYAQVAAALAALDGDITVRLNSGGGVAWEGSAIYSLLSTYDGSVAIVVDGIAASAASLIAMAGDTITMAEGAVMMIHDPSVLTIGDSSEHQKSIQMLEALSTEYARIYAKRSGKSPEDAREIMKAETWLTVEQAIEAGFADEPDADKASAVAAFDYRIYANAPRRLTAMAKRKNWSVDPHAAVIGQPKAAVSAAPTSEKEDTMSDKERADALAAELETLKAEKAAAEAKLAEIDAEKAQAVADALNADRERRAAIMALDEAKLYPELAEVLASDGFDAVKAGAYLSVVHRASYGAAKDEAAAYEQRRLAGADLNGGKPATADAGALWAKAVARINKTSKK